VWGSAHLGGGGGGGFGRGGGPGGGAGGFGMLAIDMNRFQTKSAAARRLLRGNTATANTKVCRYEIEKEDGGSLLLERRSPDRSNAVGETFWYVYVALSRENEKARPKDLNELANLLRGG
jgi:hypothetical protein